MHVLWGWRFVATWSPSGWEKQTSRAPILATRWFMTFLFASRSRSRFRSFILECLIGLFCSLMGPLTLTGQVSTTGKITGTVTDSSGGAVPSAAVSVKSTALLAPRNTRTEADGGYLFDLLPPGTYELTVTVPGFNT